MIILSDNDIIYKLAACDLLDEALVVLGVTPTDVYVLPTAKYKFGITKSPARTEAQYGSTVVTRIRNFLTQVHELDVVGSTEELRLLAEADGIDAGEAVLFSATVLFDHYLLATGDKNSLRAVASTPVSQPIAHRLSGHVICLEQIVMHIIEHFGFMYAKNKIVPARSCDTALRVAFGSGDAATELNVLAALDGYINELRSLAVDVLI
ncbi:MAG: hypothetical protein ETSY2_26520 [Candidatus Entotheonella gemina]|uniref:PIN domain-containing protein n=1 Tax=Candidatus Entotheonella gemina TaxID=1429439 RepID=W4M3T6_9BACT|nr:MAG: hypothetical protein ETSY2_26520 [Candidatus Entotheonella gemina]